MGWNWQNSRSASAAPAAWAITAPAPIAPQGLVVRRHRAAPPPVARTVAPGGDRPGVRDHPGAAAAVAQQGERRGLLQHLRPGRGRRPPPPGSRDRAPGLGAAGVNDPARRVAALQGRGPGRRPPRCRSGPRAGGAPPRPPEPRGSASGPPSARQRPRPAFRVSSAWRAGESSGASAAASPPWAQ